MKKCLVYFLSFVSLLSACNSNGTGNTTNSAPKSDNVSHPVSATIKVSEDNSTLTQKVVKRLKSLKESDVNYTLDITDYGGDFSIAFSSGVYTYRDSENGKREGYIEDANGIYGFNVSTEGVFSSDYYALDSDGNNLHSLFDNLYTFKNVDVDSQNLKEEDGRVYFKSINNDSCKVLFSLAGYDADSTYSGTTYSDVNSRYFTIDSNSDLQLSVEFNETTSGRGTTVMTIENIGTTMQDQKIRDYIATDKGGKVRVGEGSSLFKYLGYLENRRNFTIKVNSDYKTEGFTNYSRTSKYRTDAYYSYTDRKDEDDIGLIVSDGVVKTRLYNDATDKLIIGDVYKDNNGNTYKDIYSIVNSFIDLDWGDEKTFKAREIEGGKYVIEEKNLNASSDFLTDLFARFDETVLRFQLLDYTFWYDEAAVSYHIVADLVEGDKISREVTDINKTTIGDHRIGA